jgi:hypothetical protein
VIGWSQCEKRKWLLGVIFFYQIYLIKICVHLSIWKSSAPLSPPIIHMVCEFIKNFGLFAHLLLLISFIRIYTLTDILPTYAKKGAQFFRLVLLVIIWCAAKNYLIPCKFTKYITQAKILQVKVSINILISLSFAYQLSLVTWEGSLRKWFVAYEILNLKKWPFFPYLLNSFLFCTFPFKILFSCDFSCVLLVWVLTHPLHRKKYFLKQRYVNWVQISVLISPESAYQMSLHPIMGVLAKLYLAHEIPCCFNSLTLFHLCWLFPHSKMLK